MSHLFVWRCINLTRTNAIFSVFRRLAFDFWFDTVRNAIHHHAHCDLYWTWSKHIAIRCIPIDSTLFTVYFILPSLLIFLMFISSYRTGGGWRYNCQGQRNRRTPIDNKRRLVESISIIVGYSCDKQKKWAIPVNEWQPVTHVRRLGTAESYRKCLRRFVCANNLRCFVMMVWWSLALRISRISSSLFSLVLCAVLKCLRLSQDPVTLLLKRGTMR